MKNKQEIITKASELGNIYILTTRIVLNFAKENKCLLFAPGFYLWLVIDKDHLFQFGIKNGIKKVLIYQEI